MCSNGYCLHKDYFLMTNEELRNLGLPEVDFCTRVQNNVHVACDDIQLFASPPFLCLQRVPRLQMVRSTRS